MNVSDKGQSLLPDIPDFNIGTAGVEKTLSYQIKSALFPDQDVNNVNNNQPLT